MDFKKWLITGISLILLATSMTIPIEELKLKVTGIVSFYGKAQQGVVVVIYEDNNEIAQLVTTRNGKVEFELHYNSSFVLEISKKGFFTQKIIINTAVSERIVNSGGISEGFYDLVIPLLEELPNINPEVFNKPVAMYSFNDESWLFEKNAEYRASVAPYLEPIILEFDNYKTEVLEHYSNAADSLIQAREYEAASLKIQEILNLNPESKLAENLMKKVSKSIKKEADYTKLYEENYSQGLEELKKGNLEEAKTYLQKSLVYQPNNENSLGKLYEIDSIQAYKLLAERKKFNKLVQTADSLLATQNIEQALIAYQEANNTDPKNIAIAAKLDSLTQLDPKHVYDYTGIMQEIDSLTDHDHLDKASEAIDSALSIFNGDSLLMAKQSRIIQLQTLKEKQDKYRRLIEQADRLFLAKDWDNAAKSYEKALAIMPQDDYSKVQLQEIAKEHEKVQSEVEFRKLMARGSKFADQGKWQQALSSYQEASRVKPSSELAQFEILKMNQNIDGELRSKQENSSEEAKPKIDPIPANEEIAHQESINEISRDTSVIDEGELNKLERIESRTQLYKELAIAKKEAEQEDIGKIMQEIANSHYLDNEFGQAIGLYEEALEIKNEQGDQEGAAQILNEIAVAFYDSGRYEIAVDKYQEVLSIQQETGNAALEAITLDNIAQVYESTYNFDNALKYYQQSLNKVKELGQSENETEILERIAEVQMEQNDLEPALKTLEAKLDLDLKVSDETRISQTLNSIGTTHYQIGNYRKAEKYYQESLKKSEDRDDAQQQSIVLNNLGNVNYDQADYNQAINYYQQSIELKQQIAYDRGLAITLHNLGNAFEKIKQKQKAIDYYNQSLDLSQKDGYTDIEGKNLLALSAVYSKMNNYQKAYNYQKLYEKAQESLSSKTSQITESKKDLAWADQGAMISNLKRRIYKQKLLTEYQVDRRKKELEIKNLELQNQKAKNQRQRAVGMVSTFSLLLIISLIYRQYRIKTRNNIALRKKNETISFQKKQITDSIEYASKIQRAVLPPKEYMADILPEHFIFNRPRDIVSGDYYWTTQRGSESIIAVADCTGHGVPGAFMSMLGVAFLNQIVNKQQKAHSHEILNELRSYVINSLHQTGQDDIAKDGMDIALCIVDTKSLTLQFSGAHNPVFIARNSHLIELKADRMPIGIGFFKKTEKSFTSQEFTLVPGDVIYIFSDGYADQFGGELRKKLGIRKFKELLIEIHQMNMADQQLTLEKRMNAWQQDYEQIDDMMVMGIKV